MRTGKSREAGLNEFMEKIMNREIYAADGEFILSPIIDADRADYTELHRQVEGEHTFFLNPATKDMMWDFTLARTKTKVFVVLDKAGEFCGSMELQNVESDIPEIGIDLLECKRNQGIGPKMVKLLAKRAYMDKPVDYYLIRVSSENEHSKHVFEKMGVIPLNKVENAFESWIDELKKASGAECIHSFKFLISIIIIAVSAQDVYSLMVNKTRRSLSPSVIASA